MYRAIFFLSLMLAHSLCGGQVSIGSIEQTGPCATAGVIGDLTINCTGVDPHVLAVMIEQSEQRVRDRDARIKQIAKEASEWRDRFLRLTESLAESTVPAGLRQKAEMLLRAGRLDEAGLVLDEEIAALEKNVEAVARAHFERGLLYQLQMRPVLALGHFEKAYEYRRDNLTYGEAYARLLATQREFEKARSVFAHLLARATEVAKSDPAAFASVAKILNSMGALFLDMHLLPEAEAVLTRALELYGTFATQSAADALSQVAAIQSQLGNLYLETGQFARAQKMHEQAVGSSREAARANWGVYAPGLAHSLQNLCHLYSASEQQKKAIDTCTEALEMLRQLAEKGRSQKDYLLAMTLRSLGVAYHRTGQNEQAVQMLREALPIWIELAQDDPFALVDVADIYVDLAVVTDVTGSWHEVLRYASSALELYGKLPQAPDMREASVARQFANLCVILRSGRSAAATYLCGEALRLHRQLASRDSAAYSSGLAQSLHASALQRMELGRFEEAGTMLQEAVELGRDLVSVNPAVYSESLASALCAQCAVYRARGQLDQAEAACNDAAHGYRTLRKANPMLHSQSLAQTLEQLALVHEQGGRFEVAVRLREESARVRQALGGASRAN
jgi:tetratricopeptide (TPR) repeat protein